jgi:hypothetical protein
MTDIFAAGEPLDISKLNAFNKQLTDLEAKLDVYTKQQSINDSTVVSLIIRGGSTGQDLTPEVNKEKSVTCSFGSGFKAGTSPYVVITPYGIGANSVAPINYYIGGGYNNTSFNIRYYLSGTAGVETSIGKFGFNWIAVGQPE